LLWRNVAYDTVLGGGSWQRWINIGNYPDTLGLRYNAETGGNPVNWTVGSYACEGVSPLEAFKEATDTLFVVAGPVTATARETGSAENPFHTVAAALAVASSNQTVLVFPGTYSESTLVFPPGVTLQGLNKHNTIITNVAPMFDVSGGGQDRNMYNLTINAGPGNEAIVLDASVLNMRDCDFTGRVTLTGANALLNFERCIGVGLVHVLPASAASSEIVFDNTKLTGDATDFYALLYDDADPTVIVKGGSVLTGFAGGGGFAVYHDNGVQNDNLKAKYSKFDHGLGIGNIPFGVNAAQTPQYYAHHCEMTDDPDLGAFANQVPPGARYNSIDPSVGY